MISLINLAVLFTAKVVDKYHKNNISTKKSVDTCRHCGYHIRLHLFLDNEKSCFCE